MSPSCRLCPVPPAETTVVTVVFTLSTSPITWSKLDCREYNPDPIPDCVPFVWKNNPSLVLPMPTFDFNNPI